MSANQKLFIQDLQKSIQALSLKHGCNTIPSITEGDLGLEMRVVFRPKRTDANLFDENVMKATSYINRQMRVIISIGVILYRGKLSPNSPSKKTIRYTILWILKKRNKIIPLLMLSDTGELFNTDWSFFVDTKTVWGLIFLRFSYIIDKGDYL